MANDELPNDLITGAFGAIFAALGSDEPEEALGMGPFTVEGNRQLADYLETAGVGPLPDPYSEIIPTLAAGRLMRTTITAFALQMGVFYTLLDETRARCRLCAPEAVCSACQRLLTTRNALSGANLFALRLCCEAMRPGTRAFSDLENERETTKMLRQAVKKP
jgi:hypothetical protein